MPEHSVHFWTFHTAAGFECHEVKAHSSCPGKAQQGLLQAIRLRGGRLVHLGGGAWFG